MNERRANPRAGDGRARCLLWLPAGYAAPAMLLDGLRARDVVVRQAGDAPTVMVELAGGGYKTLVVVEPELLRRPQRVVDAVARYHPGTDVWRFNGEGKPVLRPWSEQPASPAAATAEVAETTEPREPRPSDGVPPPEAPLETGVAEPPLLSDEELAMLLQDPEDETPS